MRKTPGVEKQLPMNTTVCLAGGSPYAQQPPSHPGATAEAAELGEPLAIAVPSPSPVAKSPQSAARAKGPCAPSDPSPGGEKKINTGEKNTKKFIANYYNNLLKQTACE